MERYRLDKTKSHGITRYELLENGRFLCAFDEADLSQVTRLFVDAELQRQENCLPGIEAAVQKAARELVKMVIEPQRLALWDALQAQLENPSDGDEESSL